MLAAVGDLVEDVVVHQHTAVNPGSDTPSTVVRRRGGSAANVCAAAASVDGRPVRFIGQIGDDPVGEALTESLAAMGVDVAVRRRGRTGTIVVLVDPSGERTMFPDPAASAELSDPDRTWVDGVTMLHVPAYSLLRDPMSAAVGRLAGWAAGGGARISVDASSAGLIEAFGTARFVAMVGALRPAVLLANELEAEVLGAGGLAAIGAALTVIKRGAAPATVLDGRRRVEVPAVDLGPVIDSTAAGDSFAAGLLGALLDGAGPVEATVHGHQVAAAVLAGRGRR